MAPDVGHARVGPVPERGEGGKALGQRNGLVRRDGNRSVEGQRREGVLVDGAVTPKALPWIVRLPPSRTPILKFAGEALPGVAAPILKASESEEPATSKPAFPAQGPYGALEREAAADLFEAIARGRTVVRINKRPALDDHVGERQLARARRRRERRRRAGQQSPAPN